MIVVTNNNINSGRVTQKRCVLQTKGVIKEEKFCRWESAWRLSQWDSVNLDEKWVEEGPLVVNGGVNFHQHLFCALQSLHHQDLGSLYQHTLRARQEVIKQLKLVSSEHALVDFPDVYLDVLQSKIKVVAKYFS